MRDVKKVLEMRSQNYSQRQISVGLTDTLVTC